jgi:hypothetical protein
MARRIASFGLALIATASMVAASARADVAVTSRSPAAVVPGDPATVRIGSGVPRSPASFAVSLVRVDRAPKPVRCGPNAICEPAWLGVPRGGRFTYLGRAKLTASPRPYDHRYGLHFRVPHIGPGRYAFVVYCASCFPGRFGSLIIDALEPSKVLRVNRGRSAEPAPAARSGGETDSDWWVAALAAVLAAVAGTGLVARRRHAKRELRADSTSR